MNHYETLAVAPDASASEIKAAYRFQLKAFHPDKFSADTEAAERAQDRVRHIIEAYAVLSDEDRRVNYDRFLKYTSAGRSPSLPPALANANGEAITSRRVYISAALEGTGLYRRVGSTLASVQYQATYRTTLAKAEDLRPAIRKQIDHCHAVIQLVGRSYGDEPPTVDPGLGRVSYLQFEGAYARQRRKPIHYIFLGDRFTQETVVGEPEEVTRLQEAYRRRLRIVDTHPWTEVHDEEELDCAVRSFAQTLSNRTRPRSVRFWLPIAAVVVTVLTALIVTRPGQLSPTMPTASPSRASASPLEKPPTSAENNRAATQLNSPPAISTPLLTASPQMEDVGSMSLLRITAVELNPVGEADLILRLSVKAGTDKGLDSAKVQVQVVFYDSINQRITPTDADVSYEWDAGFPDWKKTNPEHLLVRYHRSREPTSQGPERNYLGYIVRLFYSDVLQEVQAEPKTLLKVFPRTASTSSALTPDSIDAVARGDYVEAARLFREAADRGDAFSKRELGRLYETGFGLVRNYYQAVALYREAAELNYVKAVYDLGRMYHDGKGVSKDFGQAAELFDKAASQNDAEALYALAWMRLHGEGVEQSESVAAALYRRRPSKGMHARRRCWHGCTLWVKGSPKII